MGLALLEHVLAQQAVQTPEEMQESLRVNGKWKVFITLTIWLVCAKVAWLQVEKRPSLLSVNVPSVFGKPGGNAYKKSWCCLQLSNIPQRKRYSSVASAMGVGSGLWHCPGHRTGQVIPGGLTEWGGSSTTVPAVISTGSCSGFLLQLWVYFF